MDELSLDQIQGLLLAGVGPHAEGDVYSGHGGGRATAGARPRTSQLLCSCPGPMRKEPAQSSCKAGRVRTSGYRGHSLLDDELTPGPRGPLWALGELSPGGQGRTTLGASLPI